MAKIKQRIVFKDGDLLSVKLRDDLYTIAQVIHGSMASFFDIFNATGLWSHIDLNSIPTLFSCYVAHFFGENLSVSKIEDTSVTPSNSPTEWRMIQRYVVGSPFYKENFPGYIFSGGCLVDHHPSHGFLSQDRLIIKENLTFPEDTYIIEKYELDMLWVAEALHERLYRYHTTGINRDNYKLILFPGLWADDLDRMQTINHRLGPIEKKLLGLTTLGTRSIQEQPVHALTSYPFLKNMYADSYFPKHLVDECKKVLLKLSERIKQEAPSSKETLLRLTHETTTELNHLAKQFYEQGSEIETVARDALCSDIEFILKQHGMTNITIDEATSHRDW